MFKNKWVCFADGGGGGTGTDATGGTGGTGTDATGGSGAESRGKDAKPPEEKKPFATFPDEASFTARVKQAANSELKSLTKELGFESVEAMQEAAKKVKEIEEKNKTDLEKEKERADKAESENAAIKETANQKLINAELKVFAVQSKFIDPEDAVILADCSKINVDKDGKVTGAKEAIETLVEAKPHLVGKKVDTPIGGPTNPGGDSDTMTEEEIGQKIAKDRLEAKKQINEHAFNPWAS